MATTPDAYPDAYRRKLRSESISGRRNAANDAARVQRRLVWLMCASVSLLSARHLLVERNIHYPQRLYFNQLAVTALVALWPCFGWGRFHRPFRRKLRPWRSMSKGTALVAASVCFMYLSVMCFLQAILHFHNLPVLVMITLIAFFAEDVLLHIIRAASATHPEKARSCVLVLASIGILFAEYRHTVPSLVTSILSMLFAGVARGLWKTVIIRHPDVLANNVNQASLHVTAGALVGVVAALIFGMNGQLFAIDAKNGSLLALNALATALTMQLGKSMVLPMEDEVANTSAQTIDAPVYRICDALTVSALTGIAGCYSTLLTRRSYANVYQFCCFLLAITCISVWNRTRMLQARLPNTRTSHSTHGHMNGSLASSNPQTYTYWKYLLGMCMASLWVTYGILNFTERHESYCPVSLDRAYVPSIPVEIVLSMYKEPMDEVTKLISNLKSMPALSDAIVTIYSKDSKADVARIKAKSGADQVITMPNVGREGETFLHHILSRWDSLARQTMFLQAGIHNPREFYTRITYYYSRPRTGYMDLGWVGSVCDCEHCSDRLFWEDNIHYIPQVFKQVDSTSTCKNVLLSYKGQFLVSAARIRGIDKNIYLGLWQAIVDEKSWAHQQGFLQGRPDEMSAPDFGYTMERLWTLLFQCSRMDLAWKCPSLVSKWRIGGEIGDCQCFDS